MIKINQRGDAVADEFVGLAALEVDDEADAAGVVLVFGVIKALGLR